MENALIRSSRLLGAFALLAGCVWIYLVIDAPREQIQGLPQKIFYAHVPCWPPAYLGFILTAIGGAGYLITRRESWDRLAHAAAEVGILFCTIGLITGPIWAKPVWGTLAAPTERSNRTIRCCRSALSPDTGSDRYRSSSCSPAVVKFFK